MSRTLVSAASTAVHGPLPLGMDINSSIFPAEGMCRQAVEAISSAHAEELDPGRASFDQCHYLLKLR